MPCHVLSTSSSRFPPSLLKRLASAASTPSTPPMPALVQIRGRSMLVRRARVLPIEAIVRGYLTGSGYAEYKEQGTVHGLKMPEGLQESQEIPGGPIFTPSTKAEQGEHDENIHPDQGERSAGKEKGAETDFDCHQSPRSSAKSWPHTWQKSRSSFTRRHQITHAREGSFSLTPSLSSGWCQRARCRPRANSCNGNRGLRTRTAERTRR